MASILDRYDKGDQEKPMRILVVDDDSIIRKLLMEVLTNDGHHITSTENGAEAVEKVKSEHFDLVFMDVHMPQLNGLEALISMRNLYPDMPVVMMDSYPDQLARQAESRGALTCMHKPFDLNEMRKIIEEVRSLTPREK
jgi:DNA-binding NtrC family response regulator